VPKVLYYKAYWDIGTRGSQLLLNPPAYLVDPQQLAAAAAGGVVVVHPFPVVRYLYQEPASKEDDGDDCITFRIRDQTSGQEDYVHHYVKMEKTSTLEKAVQNVCH
jgi:hypothetical protein